MCCTENRRIPEENLCDTFDDCIRDRSDQFLEACTHKTNGELVCLKSFFDGLIIYPDILSPQDIYDDSEHCMNGIDEICVWKRNLQKWQDPFKSSQFQEYLEFMELVESNPASTRWYTMVSREEAELLGHTYEVR